MENRAHALAAGIFIVCALLSAAVAVWWMSGRREITAEYILVSGRSLTGLNPQATVRFRGVRAGKVQDISVDPADRRKILVRISVTEGFPIMKSTRAQLNYQGVTGIAFVQLDDDGSSNEPLAGAGGELARIPLEESDLESLSNGARDVMKQSAILVGKLNAALDGVALSHVGTTLASLDSAAKKLDESMKTLPQVMAGLQRVVSDPNVKRLQSTLANLERATGHAAPALENLRTLLASLQSLGQRVDALSAVAGSELASDTLPRVNGLIADLSATSRGLRRVLSELENSPQSLVFGAPAATPGPGESGFNMPKEGRNSGG
jgi:phospholipid/cholesterol/gamma-HCH transport system substrate-binding protein